MEKVLSKACMTLLISLTLASISLAQPSWVYVNTGANHTILVSQAPLINGTNINSGDFIGVFYLDGMVEKCGGYVEWLGSQTAVTAWGDDSYTGLKDGFANSEAFIWRVWRASDGQEIEMTATYNQGLPNQGLFSINGMSGLLTLTGSSVAPELNGVLTTTSLLCNGTQDGAINLIVNGGTPPYTFQWSNGATTQDISGLSTGTYTVTVSDLSAPTAEFTWEYTNTGLNHSILIQNAPLINGLPLATGDIIGAFYLSGSVEKCGGYAEWPGSQTALSVWGDDSYTTEKDGFATNEAFIWKVWKSSDGQVVPMTATYLAFPNGGNFAANGVSAIETLTGTYTPSLGTSIVLTAVITEPIILSINGQVEHIGCNPLIGGSINIFPDGGTLPYTYTWSNGASTTSLNELAPGYYSVTLVDNNGCFATESFEVTTLYQGAPDVELGADATICYGQSYMLDAGSFASYSWSTGETTQTITVYESGVYGVTVYDINGCSDSDEISLTASGQFELGPNVYFCPGSSISLDAGGFFDTYSWSTGETTSSITVSYPGTYGLTITNGLCVASDDIQVIELPLPQVNLGADVYQCEGPFVSLDAGSFSYYQWSTGEISQSISTAVDGTYSVTVTDYNGCQNSDEIMVTNYPLPYFDFGPDVTVCEGLSYTLDPGLYMAYSWSTGANTQSIEVSSTGSYSLTVTDANGCMNYDMVYYEFNPLPQPELGSTIEICEGESLLLDGGIFASYLWSTGESTQSINGASTGVYSLTVTDVFGCTNSDEVSVLVWILPTVDLGNDVSFCSGEDYLIDAGSFTSYVWSTGSNASSIQVYETGNYSVNVTDIHGCMAYDEVNISVLPLPEFSFQPMNQTGSVGGILSLVATTSIAGSSYQWQKWQGTGFENLMNAGQYAGTDTETLTIQNLSMDNNLEEYRCVATNMTCSDTSSIASIKIHPWSFLNTGSNHSILVQAGTPITINGVPISLGDYLGVFYDSLGTLVCAGFMEYTGVNDAFSAWGADDGNDGFAAGENFKWKIWDISEGVSYPAYATYSTSFPNMGLFEPNGMSAIESLSGIESQVIPLPYMWSIFSTYISPSNSNIAAVLSPIISSVSIVKDGGGSIYWPQYSVNNIGSIQTGKGYQIKMLVADELTIQGLSITPQLSPISIPQLWSLLGYLLQSPASIAQLLSPYNSMISIVKSGAGAIYWPQYSVNNIGNMEPGKGYAIKAFTPFILTYPSNSQSFNKVIIPEIESSYFGEASRTDNNMTLGISLPAHNLIQEIGVFSPSGILIGSARVDSDFAAITVWGDESYTDEAENIKEQESFYIKSWDGSTERTMEIDWISGNNLYKVNEILLGREKSRLDLLSVQVFPNPTSEEVWIEIPDYQQGMQLIMLDESGKMVYRSMLSQSTQQIDVSRFSAGIYSIQIISGTKLIHSSSLHVSK
ncbi:MAG: T9SS type A sorting domain-containing protein [Bacteroidales bacterium]|nr:T9SS type A sorting domain-containing protein [Bacteroidales bacterium]